MSNDFFEELVSQIEREYARLQHTLGWRFLCVSKTVLRSDPRIALITANPGGKVIPADHSVASCEDGCAYLVEQWRNAPPGQQVLQKQVQLLFDAIARRTHYAKSGAALMESSLIGPFIPFRSPSLALLPRKKESRTFAQSLWSQVFQRIRPKLVITIDRETYRMIGIMLREVNGARAAGSEVFPTGWGKCTANVDEYHSCGQVTTLVRLPHLSTYKLFTRAECGPFLDTITASACKQIGQADGLS